MQMPIQPTVRGDQGAPRSRNTDLPVDRPSEASPKPEPASPPSSGGVLRPSSLRRYWENALEQACQGKTPFIVALADLDRFKGINDGWGHQVGDAFLQNLTRIWRAKLQEGEILARLGGDEFACLFCRSLRRLQLLRRKVEQELAAGFPDLPVGVSLGYAQFHPKVPQDSGALTRLADERLYKEKRRRKQRRV